MITLARQEGQAIIVNGVAIRVQRIRSDRVDLTVEAGKEVQVDREEVYKRKQVESQTK